MHAGYPPQRTLTNQPRRRQKSKAGTAIVEAALSLTVFLMMLFGTIDFARMIWTYNSLSYAARSGARYAIVHGSDSGSAASSDDVASRVKAQAIGLTSTTLVVTTTWTPDKKPGSVVKVQTSYNFAPLMPFMPKGPVSLASSSQMVISR